MATHDANQLYNTTKMTFTTTDTIELEKISFQLKEDGIIYVDFKENVDLDILDFIDWSVEMKAFCGEEKYPVLMDLTNIKNFSQEIVNYAISEDHANEFASATGIVVKTTFDRILGNFILKLTNPFDGSQLFTSREKAVSWLNFVQKTSVNNILLN